MAEGRKDFVCHSHALPTWGTRKFRNFFIVANLYDTPECPGRVLSRDAGVGLGSETGGALIQSK